MVLKYLHGRDDRCIQRLARNPEGKKALGRSRHAWEDITTVDLEEIGWEGMTGFIWLKVGTMRHQVP